MNTAWELYRWIWRLESPLYIGAPPAGALNRTRLYVPARALWGALTAEMARRRNQNQFPDYQSVAQSIQTKIRLSYLFPAEQVDNQWRAWLPRFQEGQGLVWQREGDHQTLEDRRFRMRLLSTRPGTAIEPGSNTAAEGTLREFELISPHWRDAQGAYKPVVMVGYLFCQDATLREKLARVEELFVGGDTRYGLGCLRLVRNEPQQSFFGNALVDLQARNPIIGTTTVLAHTRAEPSLLIGNMECLRGWDMPKGGMKPPELVWAPGASCQDKQPSPIQFEIQEDGLWKTCGGKS